MQTTSAKIKKKILEIYQFIKQLILFPLKNDSRYWKNTKYSRYQLQQYSRYFKHRHNNEYREITKDIRLNLHTFFYYLLIKITRLIKKRKQSYKFLLGNDEAFLSKVSEYERLPYGLIHIHFNCSKTTRSSSGKLFIDLGYGNHNHLSIEFNNISGDIDYIIELPIFYKAIYFHPDNASIVSSITINELSLFTAAKILADDAKYTYVDSLYRILTGTDHFILRPDIQKYSYPFWMFNFDLLTNEDIRDIKNRLEGQESTRKIAVFIYVSSENLTLTQQSILSLKDQFFENWTLYITFDNEDPDTLSHEIYKRYGDDERIIILTPECIHDLLASDECVHGVFLKAGDILPRHAFFSIIYNDLCKNKLLIYSDYDNIDKSGRRYDPIFLSNWDHDLYLCFGLSCYGVYFSFEKIKQLQLDTQDIYQQDPADFFFNLLLNSQDQEITHLPHILYHRFSVPDDALKNDITYHLDESKTSEYLKKLNNGSELKHHKYNKSFRYISRSYPGPWPLVSIIVLTRNSYSLIKQCISSLLFNTDYPELEIIIVDNGSDDSETLHYLDSLNDNNHIKIIQLPVPFNFSLLNNKAIEYVNGDYICLLNNDTSVINADWLKNMVTHALQPGIGIVGAKLLYPDDTIQHGGVVTGLGELAGHAFRRFPRYPTSSHAIKLHYTQELSCVTAACLLTKKSIYNKVNGLDEVNLKIAFNDVDFCLKVREAGYKIIWTPLAELYHHESATRGSDLASGNIDRWLSECDFLKKKWGDILLNDPYYNPNLTQLREDYSLAFPPRVTKPWLNFKSNG